MLNFFNLKRNNIKKKDNDRLIKPEMTISDIISKYPTTVKVFAKYGISCVGCHMSRHETLQQGMAGHYIPVDVILDEMNHFASESLK